MRRLSLRKFLHLPLVVVLFVLTGTLLPQPLSAQVCGPVTVTIEPTNSLLTTSGPVTVTIEPTNSLLTTSGRAKATVKTSPNCFVQGVNYGFGVWFENNNIPSFTSATNISSGPKIQDSQTFIAEWNIAGQQARPGNWHFRLWQGASTDFRLADRVIVSRHNFTVAYPGGNPSVSLKQPAYQIGSSAVFDIKNAQVGQDYSFWWDGEQFITNRNPTTTASSSEFKYVMPAEKSTGTKKLCMQVGGLPGTTLLGLNGYRPGDCQFSAIVTFTAGPPPPGGTGPGGTTTPLNPKPVPQNCAALGGTGIETALGCIPTSNVNIFTAWFLQWAIGIASGIAFILIIISGFQVMTAGNNPQQLQAGRELLTAAISGLIIIIFSVFLLRLIGIQILCIPGLCTQ